MGWDARRLLSGGGGSGPVSSTGFDKMAADKRYKPANPVPEQLLKFEDGEIFSPGYSIKGVARQGRASYLVRADNFDGHGNAICLSSLFPC